MTLADVVRERACACVYCLRPTWNLSAVCNRRACQRLNDRYRIRRESVSATDERGSRDPHRREAPGPASVATPQTRQTGPASFSAGGEWPPVAAASSKGSPPAGSEGDGRG